MHESQKVASKFPTKDGLDRTIIVFVFLEIQSNNVPVPPCILNQINKTYTCTCLVDNLTRQSSIFFNPSSTYLRLNKNPGCYCFFITSFFFLWEQRLCLFQRWFTVSPIHIINFTIQKLKLCFILKKKVSISEIIYF